MSLKRYNGSAWQDVANVKRYNGSAWQDVASVKKYDVSAWGSIFPIAVYAYNLGDENTSLTGGWVNGFSYLPSSGTRTKETDHLKIYSYGATLWFDTYNLIDLTNYTKLNIDWEFIFGTGSGSRAAGLRVTSAKNSETSDVRSISYATAFARRTESFDISDLNGSYYIALSLGSNPSTYSTLKAYKIWLS